jgi:hypothetical protein
LSFLPVVALYLISQRLEQAVWIDRYFVFISIPYFMMVAVAVYRLELKWVRYAWVSIVILWSLSAGIHDLRSNRMAWEGAQMGSRITWDDMARQLIADETGESGPVKIYTLTVISKGLRTGDWAISTSIDYYLDSYGEDKFQMTYARDLQALLKRSPLEDHFWIAFFNLAESPQPHLIDVLKENGYRVGDPIVFQQMYNKVVLLPVWRK